jgi:hypothetical protein
MGVDVDSKQIYIRDASMGVDVDNKQIYISDAIMGVDVDKTNISNKPAWGWTWIVNKYIYMRRQHGGGRG